MRGSAMFSKLIRVISLSLALLASACQGGDDGKITIRVADRSGNFRLLAASSGAMEGAPYTVEWSDFSSMTPLLEALDAGAVDLAGALDNLGIQAGIRGMKMKIVAAGQASSAGDALLVPKGSRIRNVADLKGKQVIVSTIRGGTADAVLVGALAEAGLSEKDVKIGYMSYTDALAAFLSGNIDAWATNDPYYAQAEQSGARLLRNGLGLRKATIYMLANSKALEDPRRRAAIKDFLARFAKARQWGNDHVDQYAAAYAKHTHMPPELALKVLKRQLPQTFGPITGASIADARQLADDYAARGLFPAGVNVDLFFAKAMFGESGKP